MELKEKFDELGRAFDEFKKANDARLKEVETKGAATGLTVEKVEKANADITRLEGQIETLTKALGRTGFGGQEKSEETQEREFKAQARKYSDDFKSYMKSGKEISAESKEYFKKAMSVDSDADGGFLVSPEMSQEIVTKVFESSPIRQLASVQTISSDSLEMLQDLDEAGSGWVGETAARTETDTPELKKIVIPVHELYAMPKATQKLLDDAAVNVEAWLAGKVSEKFMRDEATAFMSGNGVAKPKGILDYGSGDGFGYIERKETAANNAITGDELIDTQSKLKEAYQGNATWLINRLMVGYVRKLKDAISGNYLWQPGLMLGQPNMLLGRPVMFASDLASAVTASTDTMIYGDIRAGYQIVDRVGIRVIRDIYSSKPHVLFYTTKRVGGAVKNFEAIKVLKVKA